MKKACQNGDYSLVQVLIEDKKNIHVKDYISRTPLHWACIYGHSAIVSLLLENGADINCRTQFGHTPLFFASAHNKPEVMSLLIEMGAEVSPIDQDGNTPLHAASNTQPLYVLFHAGADFWRRNKEGHTVIEIAMVYLSDRNVIRLIETFMYYQKYREKWLSHCLHVKQSKPAQSHLSSLRKIIEVSDLARYVTEYM